MKIIGAMFGFIFAIVVFVVLASYILDTFPTLQPVFDEGKVWVSTIYRQVQAEYGTPIVIVFSVGIILLAVTSGKK